MSVGQLWRVPRAPLLDSRWLLWSTRIALAFCACFGAGHLVAVLAPADSGVAWFGAPAGVALALLLRWGIGLWPGVFVGAFATALDAGVAPWLAATIALGNTLGPALGALVLQRDGFDPALTRRRDVWRFALIGLGLALAVSTSNSVFWRVASGQVDWALAPSAWLHGWLGDAASALVFGLPLMTASRGAFRTLAFGPRWWPSALLGLAAWASVALATGGAAGAGGGTFDAIGATALPSPLLFVTPVLLGWLAARSGLLAASLCTALLSTGWALATLAGHPFALSNASLAGDASTTFAIVYLASLLATPLAVVAFTGEIAALERRWHQTFDSSLIGLGEWDVRLGQIDFSPRWLALTGRAGTGLGESVQSFWSGIHGDDVAALQGAFERLRSPARSLSDAQTSTSDTLSTSSTSATCRMACGDGVWRMFVLQALVSERGATGTPLRIVLSARLSQHVATELHGDAANAMPTRAQLAPGVLEHLHEGVLVTDAAHRVLEVNPTFARITGHSREEILTLGPSLLRPAEPGTAAARQQAEMSAALAAEGLWHGEMRGQRRDGLACLLQVTVSVLHHADGSVRNYIYAMADITDAREQLEQLQRQAHFDELTRLPNRTRLSQMLDAALQTSRRDGTLLTVCYLDLDHFKPVNDQFGHDAGDRLLLELANRMRRSLRSWAGGDDVVARIGGDEFVLLLRTATIDESRHAVERVLSQICQPYALGVTGGPVTVTASIGATVFPLDGADADTLLRHADHAMYGAKQAGRNGYLFFDAEHNRRTEARFVALGRVQEALDANEFRLYFQPKVDMRSGTVLGMEALLRWNHPDKGVIAPGHFLPLIENTGLSGSVGNWVLQNGIDQLAQWLREGLDLGVSINVSARHLQDPLFAQQLAALLSRHDASVARHLTIEVLETAALADVDYTCALMQECRALGVRFALDDFGTGYSTFTYLKRLPIDMLKIDRSFVTNMLSDRQDLAIVEGVIGLSQTFGCTVVAEGVETPEQAQRLIEIGCEVGQGNGIAAAMPAEQVVAWVRGFDGLVRDVAPVTR